MLKTQDLANKDAVAQQNKVFQIEEESVMELQRLKGMVKVLEGKVMSELPQE
jgi:hypothetical protein